MKKIRFLALVWAVLLTLTGCSLDVESYLYPPAVGGQQQAVQEALETYLRDTYGVARYSVRYPVEGQHTAAFILCDDQGFPVTEEQTPSLAVAFYALSSAPDTTRMNLLRRDADQWVSVADTAGNGLDIRQVAFGDLNGDGTAELVAGWTTFSDRTHRVAVYAPAEGLSLLAEGPLYASLYVGDLTADSSEDLVLFTIGEERVSAALYALTENGLAATDTVALDGGITAFGQMTLCRLAVGVHGLFVEGAKQGNTAVTELIYYDDTGLCAPFYDPATNSTPVTTRSGRLAARDIDGDAMVEIPDHILLSDHAESDVGGTVTRWRRWDYATDSWQVQSHTLVNRADGYLVTVDDWRSLHTAYDPATRTLMLADRATRRGWLWLSVEDTAPDAPEQELKSTRLFTADGGEQSYYAWYDPTVIEAEKIGYIVSKLTARGG